jgi:hypothetical protein
MASPVNENKMPSVCQQLSGDEQIFAAKLEASNKKMFCSDFTPLQRGVAMDMAEQTDDKGNTMFTPDQAVMKVAKDNGMMPIQPSKP